MTLSDYSICSSLTLMLSLPPISSFFLLPISSHPRPLADWPNTTDPLALLVSPRSPLPSPLSVTSCSVYYECGCDCSGCRCRWRWAEPWARKCSLSWPSSCHPGFAPAHWTPVSLPESGVSTSSTGQLLSTRLRLSNSWVMSLDCSLLHDENNWSWTNHQSF